MPGSEPGKLCKAAVALNARVLCYAVPVHVAHNTKMACYCKRIAQMTGTPPLWIAIAAYPRNTALARTCLPLSDACHT